MKVQGIQLALAICYEISVEEHSRIAFQEGVQIYLASVARNKVGIKKAKFRLAQLAEEYAVPAMMCNAVGPMEDGPGHGESGMWKKGGVQIGSLNHMREGLLIWGPGAKDKVRTFELP